MEAATDAWMREGHRRAPARRRDDDHGDRRRGPDGEAAGLRGHCEDGPGRDSRTQRQQILVEMKLFLHARISVSGAPVEQFESMRDELIQLAKKYGGDRYGVRIKRRVITADRAEHLLEIYEQLAAETARRH